MTPLDVVLTGTGERAGGRPTAQVQPGRAFTTVTQTHPFFSSMRPLETAIENAMDGDCVAYAVAVDTPILTRLMTLATFRVQRRRAERAIERGGGEVLAHYGVDPSLAEPACFYELNSAAADYADRCVRPRGPAPRLRRIVTRWCGCDPALGGVLVVGRKSC